MRIAPALPEHRSAILDITRGVGVFGGEDVQTVAELFDGYLRDPQATGYNYLSACAGDETVLGFACWGPASLSRGAADLYWICTAPAAQGGGVASELFRAVTQAVRSCGRWLLVVWTSSRPGYRPARRLYERMGCTLSLQLADFYDRGDDLCIYTLRLD